MSSLISCVHQHAYTQRPETYFPIVSRVLTVLQPLLVPDCARSWGLLSAPYDTYAALHTFCAA